MFFATQDIEPHSEIITEYGAGFWNVMCEQSLKSHLNFYNYIAPYCDRLETMVQRRSVPIPKIPDHVIERDELFKSKIKPYNPPPEDSGSEDDEMDTTQTDKHSHSHGNRERKMKTEKSSEDDGEKPRSRRSAASHSSDNDAQTSLDNFFNGKKSESQKQIKMKKEEVEDPIEEDFEVEKIVSKVKSK